MRGSGAISVCNRNVVAGGRMGGWAASQLGFLAVTTFQVAASLPSQLGREVGACRRSLLPPQLGREIGACRLPVYFIANMANARRTSWLAARFGV